MLKKFISIITLLSVFNTYAAKDLTASQKLDAAFENLSYSLEVEWDQKDKNFHRATVKKFREELKAIVKKDGLSSAEMVNFVKSKMKDEKAKSDLDFALLHIQMNKLPAEQAQKYLIDAVGKSYSQGANYSGDVAIAAVAAVLLIAIIVVAAVSGDIRSPSNCYDEYICYDYFDDWYGWLTDCYWDTVCYY